MFSKAQMRRDIRAILTVLPKDGTPMTMAQILLQAGEGLYPAMNLLEHEGRVKRVLVNETTAYVRL